MRNSDNATLLGLPSNLYDARYAGARKLCPRNHGDHSVAVVRFGATVDVGPEIRAVKAALPRTRAAQFARNRHQRRESTLHRLGNREKSGL